MFVQVIEARTTDAAGVRRMLDRWEEDLMPGAPGFLGATAGVTTDGKFVTLVRFEDEEAGRASSDRAEQGQWWEELEKYLEGEARFHESSDVELLFEGGDDGAGFVQVMRGRCTDRRRLDELREVFLPAMRALRPEIVGGLRAWHDSEFTEAVFFESEHAARSGERVELPDELADRFEEYNALFEEMRYLDLPDPWLVSPG